MATRETVLKQLPQDLPLDFLRTITDQFSAERIIGTGGFGTVYKGIMPDEEPIAVKKLAENAPLARDKAFTNEVQNMMALRNENIVRLVGYCHEGQKKVVQNNGRYIVADVFESLLCYEYLPKGSLQKNLFDGRTNMEWCTRFKIIKGICNGLLFLHRIPIIHMDLKPENILLDHNMTPKIADFGLSRLFGQEQTRANTQNVVGSYGYIAPEYLYRGEISTQSDIYSLGLLIIETTTGEKNQPKQNEPSARDFIEKVRQTWTYDYIASMFPKFNANDLQEVRVCIEIGLECVQIDRKKRPSVENIVERLNGRCANRM
jgi:serine/threonine protein kinase